MYEFFKLSIFDRRKNDNEKRFRCETLEKNIYIMIDIIIIGIVSIILSFLSECVSRNSLYAAIEFVCKKKMIYLVNTLFISFLFSGTFLFKKRLLAMLHCALSLVIFCLVHYLLILMRGTPFIFADLQAVKFGLSIFWENVDKGEVIPVVMSIVGIYCTLFYFSYKKNYKRKIIIPIFYASLLFVFVRVIEGNGMIATTKWEQNTDYLSNGVYVNFYQSYLDSQIAPPSLYSKDRMEYINTLLRESPGTEADTRNFNEEIPNIIILQVEAWMDPCDIPGIKYNKDPIPNLRKLMQDFPSGKLDVEIFGGSTVNTEFEILTGLPMEYQPAGEYPYLTTLSYKAIESLPQYLHDNYMTTAIHNYYGDFYNRDIVFSNMGFERFVPMETMDEIWYEGYYPSDGLFNVYIPRVIEDSEEKDFIYSIYVQSHGPYSSEKMENPDVFSVGAFPDPLLDNLNWYTNSLYSIDQYIGELINYFEEMNEPVVCFIFGDHQPALALLSDSEFRTEAEECNFYEVPWICYNNYGLEGKDENLEAYRVADYLLTMTNNDGGIVSKFHSVFENNTEYDTYLELLEYDIMNGKQYVYLNESRYYSSEIEYGMMPMTYTEVLKKDDGSIEVIGNGFNEKCRARVNGKEVGVTYQSDSCISIHSEVKAEDTILIYRKGLYRNIGNTIEIDGESILHQ